MSDSTAILSEDLTQLTGTYAIDAVHSRIGFQARHALVTKVRGTFKEFEGTLELNGDDPTRSTGEVVVQVDSIDTGNFDRDGHLRTNDFFAMSEYPEIRFAVTGITAKSESDYEVTGDLTMRGVTKEVTFDVEFLGAALDMSGAIRVGFEGKTTVNRHDWGVSWNAPLEAGGVLVSDKVTLEFEFAAVKQS